ncbi:NAD-dependent epimerase/dehydratase family protein [Olivibacter domesticus]|uniref:NAD dependent epimerase/dehydratase family protein n=1 Tax=Olivibacter domesticus TaxID=407022 RepID=A0A1H7S6C7_OLID1|nr:NAD-dependent epimerase/dehydratase family protein [Olivibacter domesticus]SEL68053.1 NAD dependent epimerase/dehydratase family protein [Olivibacter domesticus]
MTALIYGATGLIGSQLLSLLIESTDYQNIIIFTRKKIDVENKKVQIILDEFNAIKKHKNNLKADHVFCCLGTTRKKTPDKKEYYKIDHDYPLIAAAIAIENNCKHFHLVSSIGANKESLFFYTKTKGKLENDISFLPFESINIYRPSLLLGQRREKRSAEDISAKILHVLNPALIGPLKKYKGIKAFTVAKAMYNQSLNNSKGINIFLPEELNKIA